MLNLFYCENCLNNNQTINKTKTITTKSGKSINLTGALIINGFIDFQVESNITPTCPHCNNVINKLSLNTNDWEIIQSISTDSTFVFEMNKLKQNSIIDFNEKLLKYKNTLTPKEINNTPKCPICSSTNIKKISIAKRYIGIGLFGLTSSNIGHTMKCNKCGYKF